MKDFQDILTELKPKTNELLDPPFYQRTNELNSIALAQENFKLKHTYKACDAFIDTQGNIGKYGKLIAEKISRVDVADIYFNTVPKDFTNGTQEKPEIGLCPNFENMSTEQKKLFWIWFFKSFAHYESSCKADPVVVNKASNPTSGTKDRGMLQLSTNACGKVNLDSAEVTFDCGTRLLAKEMRYRERLTDVYDKSKETTYWGPLRTDDSNFNNHSPASICNAINLRNFIREFPLCGATKKEPICSRATKQKEKDTQAKKNSSRKVKSKKQKN